MKFLIKIILIISFALSATWPGSLNGQVAFAAATSNSNHPSVLCMPGIYTYEPGDCLLAGPAGYLTQMAKMGFSFPPAKLAYTPIDQSLGAVDLHYGEVVNMPAPVYSSVEDAVQSSKKGAVDRLNGYFVFVSYQNEQQSGGKKIYQIDLGRYITGNYISRVSVLPPGRGITFSSTPLTAFGWVLTYFSQTGQVEVVNSPAGIPTGRILNLYDIVQVFGEEKAGNDLWYQIGPDEWVLSKFIARVTPNTTPPAGVSNDRWIEVNLFEQTLAVYDKRQLVFATIIASGADPFYTQPGVFQIFEKHELAPMSGSFESNRSDAYYLEDVPWIMYYDGARALHGAYWRAKMGFEQSHGCVNLTVADAHWLFNWANIDDYVYVWDPSGKTPTDPNLYKGGGY